MPYEYAWLFQFGTQAGDVGARVLARAWHSVILLACHESHLRVSPPPPTLSERLQSHLRNFLNSSSLDLASRSKSHNASSLSLGQWQAIHASRRRYYEPCSSCLNSFVRRKRLLQHS